MAKGHEINGAGQTHAGRVTVIEVREAGVFGLCACPTGSGPFPGVVAFGGSGGGMGPTTGWAPALASRGFAVLAIAYFGAPGLPEALINIEVEVVERAVGWLRHAGVMDGDVVGVIGMSRGSELALLASVLLDGVGPVVAFSPSGISWSGIEAAGPVSSPAWTFRGDGIPFARTTAAPPEFVRPPAPDAPPLALRPIFEMALADPTLWRQAEIAVECANGPILLVSGEDDAMWPATTMATMIERRAADRGFRHQVVHLHYAGAGHTGAGVPSLPAETEVRHPLTGGYYALGGTNAGNAAARKDSWPQWCPSWRTRSRHRKGPRSWSEAVEHLARTWMRVRDQGAPWSRHGDTCCCPTSESLGYWDSVRPGNPIEPSRHAAARPE